MKKIEGPIITHLILFVLMLGAYPHMSFANKYDANLQITYTSIGTYIPPSNTASLTRGGPVPTFYASPGLSYPYTLASQATPSNLTRYWYMWIDLNGDGDYTDSGELVFNSGAVNTATITSDFTLPSASAFNFNSETTMLIGVTTHITPDPNILNDEVTLRVSRNHYTVEAVDDGIQKTEGIKECIEIEGEAGNASFDVDFKLYAWFADTGPSHALSTPIQLTAEVNSMGGGTSGSISQSQLWTIYDMWNPSLYNTKVVGGTTYYRYFAGSHFTVEMTGLSAGLYEIVFSLANYPNIPSGYDDHQLPLRIIAGCDCGNGSKAYTITNPFPAISSYIRVPGQISAEGSGSAELTIPNGKSYIFVSEDKITLKPGFHVESGGQFIALTKGCGDEADPIFERRMPTVSGMEPIAIEKTTPSSQKLIPAPSSEGLVISAYPNPFRDEVTIDYEISQDTEVSIRVLDARGVPVHIVQEKAVTAAGRYEIFLQTSELSAGFYVCWIEAGGTNRRIKLHKY